MASVSRLCPFLSVVLLLLQGPAVRAADRDDILIADFEGKDYGDWKATGEAFGPGPAQGTLPGQMPVTGYKGKGLVNSFYGGDKSTGTLTSPSFKIQRKYLNFLIGGGKHPGETCINLLREGKIVRTATGPNDRPGGSEHLDWHTWDVQELAGQDVVIQVVDQHTGGWGHINIDHIVQSDKKLQAEPAHRDIAIDSRYLHLPIKTGAPKRRMRFVVDGRTVREFEIEWAEAEPDFWAFSDVSPFRGRKLRIEVNALPGDSRGLAAITQGNDIRGADALYKEKHRPQFHFTSRRGWLNDPNGLVYHKGEYHLFYQHNPYGWDWGNMHWGHAVSTDLVHWRELPIALYPRRFDDWCFSGSAVVDRKNTSGFKTGAEDVLVAAYTSTGRGECIAYSNDHGRTWTDYRENPVVKHTGRDPKVIWHETSRRWVMAVFDETAGKSHIVFYNSADLKRWQFQSRIEGFFECPEIFELPVDGKDQARKWVLYAADGKYLLGKFDGKSFTPESGKHQLWHGNFYASQTFNGSPDGRRIQIGWGNGITFPGMPFNQQMTFPCQLTLRTTADGVRLFAEPVKEIETIRGKRHAWSDQALKPGDNLLAGITGDLFEIRVEFDPAGASAFGFTVRGVPVVYDVRKREISCNKRTAPLPPLDAKVRLHLLIDRGSFEVFGNDGRVALSVGVIPADEQKAVAVFSRGGSTRLHSLEVFELKSAWPER
jgi:fructan beta-fructosidase